MVEIKISIKEIKQLKNEKFNEIETKAKELVSDNRFLIGGGVAVAIVTFLLTNALYTIFFGWMESLLHSTLPTFPVLSFREIFTIHFNILIFYVIFEALAIFNYVKFALKLKKSYASINHGQFGTREFETLKELKKQYKCIPEKTETFKGGGGAIMARYEDWILIDDSAVNNCIIGITRSGKGETYIVPQIDIYSRAENQASMILNDPKGELLVASYDKLRERGYEVYSFNAFKPNLSMSFNPLQLVIDAYKRGDTTEAEMLCNTISASLFSDPNAKDPFWQDTAQALFNAVALAITIDALEKGNEEQITMYSVANFIAVYGESDAKGNNLMDYFFRKRPKTCPARMQYSVVAFAPGTTKGSVFSSAQAKMKLFLQQENAKMTSQNSLDLEKVGFGDKPVAIFMVTPDYDKSNHPIASVFVRQLYFILAKKASISKGNRCTREVVFMLDEAGNMSPIDDLANMVTVCLGRNIRFYFVIQAYAQFDALYGDSAAKTIIGNCGNQIYLLSADADTAKHFSTLLGNRTIVDVSRSGEAFSFKKNISESGKEQPLLDIGQLLELENGEAAIFRSIKRADNNKKNIKPRPIYCHGETRLKFRYEYLADDFDTSGSLYDLPIKGSHIDVDIKSLVFGNASKYDRYKKMKILFNEMELAFIKTNLSDYISEEVYEELGLPAIGEMTIIQLKAVITKFVVDPEMFEELTSEIQPFFDTSIKRVG